MSLQIANLKVAEGCFSYAWSPKLIQLYIWYAARYNNATITCGYEHRDYSSLHCTNPLRAIDIRIWQHEDPMLVAGDINHHWKYDPDRPEFKCCVFGDADHLDHFHFQVHTATMHTGG